MRFRLGYLHMGIIAAVIGTAVAATMLIAMARPARGQSAGGNLGAHGVVEVEIQLGNEQWRADQPITGTILFRVLSARDGKGLDLRHVVIKQATARIVMQTQDMEATLTLATTKVPHMNPTRVRQDQPIPFRIELDPRWRERLGDRAEGLRLFNPGEHRIRAIIDTRKHRPGLPPEPADGNELAGQFESEWKSVKIDGAHGRTLSRDQLLEILAGADDDLLLGAVNLYAHQRVLASEQMVALIDRGASAELKIKLAQIHVKEGFPLDDLKLFQRPSGPVTLSKHDGEPLYLRLRPGASYEVTHDARELHDFAGPGVRRAPMLIFRQKTFNLQAPPSEGIYRADCDVHKKAWYYVLVQREVKVQSEK